MPSNNRRRGPSNRQPYLKPAPMPDGEETADRQNTGAALGDDVDAPWAPSSQVTVTLAQDEYMQLLDRVDRIEGRPSSLSSPSGLLEGPGAQEHEPADDEDAPFAPVSATPPARQQLADLEPADEEPSGADATTDPAQLDSPTVDQSREAQQGTSSVPADLVQAHAFDPDPTFEKLALGSAGAAPTRPPGAAPGSAAIDTAPIRPARRRGRHLTDVRPEHAAQRPPGQRRIATSVLFSRVRSPRHVAAGAVVALALLALASVVGVVGGHGREPVTGAKAVTDAASIGAKPVVETKQTKRTPASAVTTRKRHKQAAHRTHRRSEHRHQQSTPQRRLRTHAASPVHYTVAASTAATPTTAPTQTTPTQTTPSVTTPAPSAPAAPSSPSSPGPSSSRSGTSSSSGTPSSAPAKQPAFGLGGELGPGHSPNS